MYFDLEDESGQFGDEMFRLIESLLNFSFDIRMSSGFLLHSLNDPHDYYEIYKKDLVMIYDASYFNLCKIAKFERSCHHFM